MHNARIGKPPNWQFEQIVQLDYDVDHCIKTSHCVRRILQWHVLILLFMACVSYISMWTLSNHLIARTSIAACIIIQDEWAQSHANRNETKGKHQVKWQLCFRICTNKKNHIKRNGHARKQAIALKNIKWISFGYLDLCFVFALRFQTRCDRLAIQIYTTFACDHFSKLLSN